MLRKVTTRAYNNQKETTRDHVFSMHSQMIWSQELVLRAAHALQTVPLFVGQGSLAPLPSDPRTGALVAA